MDFTSVLFLPLLGGYLFFTHFNGTRYAASAFPVQRLIFPSAALGLIFLFGARSIQGLINESIDEPDVWRAVFVAGLLPGIGFGCAVASIHAWSRVRKRQIPDDVSDRVKNEEIRKKKKSLFTCKATFAGSCGGLLFPFLLLDELPNDVHWIIALPAVPSLLLLIYLCRERLSEITLWPKIGLQVRMAAAAMIVAGSAALIVCYAEHAKDVSGWWGGFVSPEGSSPSSKSLSLPVMSLLVAFASLAIANLVITPGAGAVCRALGANADLLRKFLTNSLLHDTLAQVTLKSGKVYIGWIDSQLAMVESADGHFSMIPVLSGHRDESQKLVITTKYGQVYEALIAEAKKADAPPPDLDRYSKILRLEDVESAAEFDPAIYERFNAPTNGGNDG